LKTAIIPEKPYFYGVRDEPDLKAICVFAALGFFLGTDTYWRGEKTLPAAAVCRLNAAETELISAEPYFRWHYRPRKISLELAVEEFAALFEKIVAEQTANRRVILPLSGGLDSRTQAAALKKAGKKVFAYSYAFANGHDETLYGERIAGRQEFPFESWTVESGYLWDVIDDLAGINGCYSEFTHPRQMAFIERLRNLPGEVFSLGHWGDVLFDDMGVPDDLGFEEQIGVLLKKIVKKGGLELASRLWEVWGLEGDFREYLNERIKTLHAAIDIGTSANARIRAFKSLYWATRWTSVNLSVFASVRPLTLPYYDRRLCEFICTVPEEHLAGRKIQIEYLKKRAPQLAALPWQQQRPFNLYNYSRNRAPWNLPYRIYGRLKRRLRSGKYIRRNWELQFAGPENDARLRRRLFDEPALSEWVPPELVREFYEKFTTRDAVRYAHSVSMLLTLSLFSRHFKTGGDAHRRTARPEVAVGI
jgi:asparagine synthetase B (glutamine-hydrolysing)